VLERAAVQDAFDVGVDVFRSPSFARATKSRQMFRSGSYSSRSDLPVLSARNLPCRIYFSVGTFVGKPALGGCSMSGFAVKASAGMSFVGGT
jgi:hypothetical protein